MTKIKIILVANRGEIASRIFRTCRKMGIITVAVYSEADKEAPFVKQADLAVFIGESEPLKSYLDQDKIIDAAKRTKADAIHPGYGFLSENETFAERCIAEGFIFIGPNAKAIAAMGSKSQAKKMMEENGVPVIPGYKGKEQSVEKLKAAALEIGFPLLLKATAGGGGKGMRIVHQKENLTTAIEAAKREATSAFGDHELIIEKYIEGGRHIEFQIFGDQQGHVIHLLERECSIQRRYQKVIEESPSPVMTEKLRMEMGQSAIKAAQAIHYDNAGTVEFIFDEKTGQYYFLEVNTRLQVEHPVTEAITGLDLVQMQIEVAQGLPLSITQEEVVGKGYAIEARLYAEDPTHNFAPVTGMIHQFEFPEIEGLRMETAVESGTKVSVFYDPMIAKIIVWDKDRMAAQNKLRYVLRNLICQGITTNQDFLIALLENEHFQKGTYDTHFIDQRMDLSTLDTKSAIAIEEAMIASTLFAWNKRNNQRTLLKGIPSGWRNSFYDYQFVEYQYKQENFKLKYRYQDQAFLCIIGEKESTVQICKVKKNTIRLEINGLQKDFSIFPSESNYQVHSPTFGNITLVPKDRFPKKEIEKIKGAYEAPMPAQIIKVAVHVGDEVKIDTPLVVVSSMKMENTICANEDGIVEEVYVEAGTNVEAGFILLKIKST